MKRVQTVLECGLETRAAAVKAAGGGNVFGEAVAGGERLFSHSGSSHRNPTNVRKASFVSSNTMVRNSTVRSDSTPKSTDNRTRPRQS